MKTETDNDFATGVYVTNTRNEHVPTLPLASTAVYVTLCGDLNTENDDPGVDDAICDTTPILSLAVGGVHQTAALSLMFAATTVILPGQLFHVGGETS